MVLEIATTKALAELILKMSNPLSISFAGKSATELHQEQMLLLQELTKSGIDPQLFDLMLSTSLDRQLKKNFGIAFFLATIFFTMVSFGLIILNSTQKWGISDVAITGLIIETPLQFIGLLYIIARNLFPQPAAKAVATNPKPEPRAKRAPNLKATQAG
jgi:hypothetical protein